MEATTFALPVTERQIAYARSLARRNKVVIPWVVQTDGRSLSRWIDDQAKLKAASQFDAIPSWKQVGYAEKIARLKGRTVPDECFRDKKLMSSWIESNR